MTTETSRQFEIPTHFISENQARMTKLHRRCDKLGVPHPVLSFGEPFIVTLETDEGYRYKEEHCIMTIDMTAPVKYNGWELLARLEHDPSIGTLVNCVPGKTVPVSYQNADASTCEHCNIKNKTRKDTFVLLHEDGTLKQVGRQCIRDFLGHDVARSLLLATRIYADIDEEVRQFGGLGLSRYVVEPEEFGTIAMAVLRVEGFRPSSFENSTKSVVWNVFYPGKDEDQIRKSKEIRASVIESDKELATAAISYWKGVTSEDNFEQNCRKILSAVSFNSNHIGIAAAAFNQYLKILGRSKAIAKKAESKYVGTVGEKFETKVNVIRRFSYDTMYGLQIVNIMEDENGNSIVWKTSTSNVEIGKTYMIRGRVKKHSIYTPKNIEKEINIQQTELTRCKVEEIKG